MTQSNDTDDRVQNALTHCTETLGFTSSFASSVPQKMTDGVSNEPKTRLGSLSVQDICGLLHGFDTHSSFDYNSALHLLLLDYPSCLPRLFSECPSLSDAIIEALRRLDIDDLYVRDSSKAVLYVVFQIVMLCGLGLENNQDTVDSFLFKSLSSLLDTEELGSVSVFYQPLFTRLMQSIDVDETKCTAVRNCFTSLDFPFGLEVVFKWLHKQRKRCTTCIDGYTDNLQALSRFD